MSQVSAVISLPSQIKRGEVFEVKTLVRHPMETGYRRDSDGQMLARDLIRKFTCHLESEGKRSLVFEATLFAAVSANPYLAFPLRAVSAGTLVFEWRGDNGFVQTERMALNVV